MNASYCISERVFYQTMATKQLLILECRAWNKSMSLWSQQLSDSEIGRLYGFSLMIFILNNRYIIQSAFCMLEGHWCSTLFALCVSICSNSIQPDTLNSYMYAQLFMSEMWVELARANGGWHSCSNKQSVCAYKRLCKRKSTSQSR